MINTIIFDMNGVIVIDEKYHQLARRKLLKKYNIHSSKEEFKNITLGRTNKEILRYFFKDLSEDDFRKYSNEKTEYAMNLCLPHLTPPAGLIELLDYLYRRWLKIGIATSSRKDYADFIIDNLKIRERIDVMITADDIKKGKPDPEIYLLCAKMINTDPSECVAIEDSPSGIRSAKNAGMRCIGMTTTLSTADLQEADIIVNHFNDIQNLFEEEKFSYYRET